MRHIFRYTSLFPLLVLTAGSGWRAQWPFSADDPEKPTLAPRVPRMSTRCLDRIYTDAVCILIRANIPS